jgi:hypothetical protein
MINNDRLHTWFGLSRASFLTLPRVLMQEMPNEWQEKMAELLEQYEETFNTSEIGVHGTKVMAVDESNKFIKMPEDILNYRHPNKHFINGLKSKNTKR